MANPAFTTDLESRWRTLSPQETINGDTFLDDAWVMLKRRIADIEANIATDADLNAEVVRVLATAVLRVMKNPDGKSQEAIDDYSWQRDHAVASGLLYFSDEEIEGLIPGGTSRRGAWSFDPLGVNYPDARFPLT